MTMLHMIVEIIALGVRLVNQEELNDEQVELTRQFIQLQVTGAELILCGLAIPLIAGLIIFLSKLRRVK